MNTANCTVFISLSLCKCIFIVVRSALKDVIPFVVVVGPVLSFFSNLAKKQKKKIMSRRANFMKKVEWGEYDGVGDDESYYEDELSVDDERAVPEVRASNNRSARGGAALCSSDADYELIAPSLAAIREIFPTAEDAVVVGVLRECNYCADAATAKLAQLLQNPPTPEQPRASVSLTEIDQKRQGGNAVFATRKLRGGKAKQITIGSTASTHAEGMSRSSTMESTVAPPAPSPSQRTDTSPFSPLIQGTPVYGTSHAVDAEGKLPCTLIVAGHVDSGKSTILGHLLLKLGHFTARDVERNLSAAPSNKQSFKYAWLLDDSEEERRRGITIDAAAREFCTATKRVAVLDAPGHKDFIVNMVTSATQADYALLVVTASDGEFESGLHHGTKEHLIVLRTLGVAKVVVAVNKMDSVSYRQERFDAVVAEVMQLAKQLKYKDGVLACFVPTSGLLGENLIAPFDHPGMEWYHGPTLIGAIDDLPGPKRAVDSPLRLTVQEVCRNSIYAHVVAGRITRGDTVVFYPSNVKVDVKSLGRGEGKGGGAQQAIAGETVEVTASADLTGLYPGCVGSSSDVPLKSSTLFEVQLQTFSTLQQSILPGSRFTLAIHSLLAPVTVSTLIAKLNPSTRQWSTGMVKAIPKECVALVTLKTEEPVVVEPIEASCKALGRFALMQGTDIVGGGLVSKVL